MGRAAHRVLRRDTGGAVAIEFAFIIGALIILILGTLQVGLALQARNLIEREVTRAVREIHLDEAGENGAQFDYCLNEEMLEADFAAQLEYCIDSQLGFHGQDDGSTVNLGQTESPGIVRVEVSYPYRLRIPLLPSFDIPMRFEALANRGD